MTTALTNAAIFNGVDNALYPGKSVLIENERIAQITDSHAACQADRIIDLHGQTVMPGLIDAHIHIMLYHQADQSLAFEAIRASILLKQILQRGFTTIRDVGGDIWGIVRAANAGMFTAPRVLYAGRVLSQTGGHGDMRPARDTGLQYLPPTYANCNQTVIVDGVEAIRKAARENFVKGASFVKIMASGGCTSPHDTIFNDQFSIEEIRAAVEIAQTYHSYTAAHAYLPQSIKRCIENGVRTIEHGNFLDQETAALMARQGAFLVPTLITYTLACEDVARGTNHTFFVSGDVIKSLRDKGLAAITQARQAKVKIGFGTDIVNADGVYDTTSAFSRQSDEFLVRAQVEAPFDTLHSATAVNAEILNMQDQIGVVKPGALADLLVVDGNPLDDISLLTGQGAHIKAIIKNGVFVKDELA
ncbi:MAG: amidohydrolase family protein [bacterium]|nr:amidohydrolase family protein [bacterium]